MAAGQGRVALAGLLSGNTPVTAEEAWTAGGDGPAAGTAGAGGGAGAGAGAEQVEGSGGGSGGGGGGSNSDAPASVLASGYPPCSVVAILGSGGPAELAEATACLRSGWPVVVLADAGVPGAVQRQLAASGYNDTPTAAQTEGAATSPKRSGKGKQQAHGKVFWFGAAASAASAGGGEGSPPRDEARSIGSGIPVSKAAATGPNLGVLLHTLLSNRSLGSW